MKEYRCWPQRLKLVQPRFPELPYGSKLGCQSSFFHKLLDPYCCKKESKTGHLDGESKGRRFDSEFERKQRHKKLLSTKTKTVKVVAGDGGYKIAYEVVVNVGEE